MEVYIGGRGSSSGLTGTLPLYTAKKGNSIDLLAAYGKYSDKQLSNSRDELLKEAKGVKDNNKYRRELLRAAQAMDMAIAYHKYGSEYWRYKSSIKVR